MDVVEAADTLRRMYISAPKDEKVAHIHLFGIMYAKELSVIPIKSVVIQSGLPKTYVTEVNKGKNLAKYVKVKDDHQCCQSWS